MHLSSYAYEGTANVHLQLMDGWVASSQIQCQLFCPVINIAMSNNLNTLMCTLHNFPVFMLDLVIQALLLDYMLALEKKYAYALCASCFYTEINIFKHF